jgi:hypothetical protein
VTFQTSGVLRDANTGIPIPNSCVAWRSESVTSMAFNGTSTVDPKGQWKIYAPDPGPFYIAFYVTARKSPDCRDQVLTGPDNYRASWYRAQPFTGTDPSTALPPGGASLVTAGSTIVACLAKQNVLPTECAPPTTAAATTTSGVLRDAKTGAPIRNGCVAWRSVSWNTTATNAVDAVDDRGQWSIKETDPGPYYFAFYVTDGIARNPQDRRDYCRNTVLTGPDNYRASWYRAQPFTGTDPNRALPPPGASRVTGGSTIVACLAKENILPTECATPNTTVSGRVVSFGPEPVFQACVAALGPDGGDLGGTSTDADGRWTLTGLPVNYDFVVIALPPFRSSRGPCDSDGPPPVPPPGGLQPEFYDDTWADLSDPDLQADPFAWATDPNSPHPAVVIRNSRAGLYACLTTETGRATQRGSCDPATLSPTTSTGTQSTGSALAATGGPSPLGPTLGAALLLGGAGLLARSRWIGRPRSDHRRPTWISRRASH